jgi:hypothetical protein
MAGKPMEAVVMMMNAMRLITNLEDKLLRFSGKRFLIAKCFQRRDKMKPEVPGTHLKANFNRLLPGFTGK